MKGRERRFLVAVRVLRGETYAAVAADYGVTRARIADMFSQAIRETDVDMAWEYRMRCQYERRRGHRWVDLLRANADKLVPLVEAKMKEVL